MGEGWVGVMSARSPLATPRVSEIWSIRERRNERDFLKQKMACWDRMSFFAAPLQRHRHPHPNPPHRGGGLLRARYVTAIERHYTSDCQGNGSLPPRSGLKKHLGWVAEKDLADGFVMGVAGLDLLRHCVDVAEAALEGAAGEDRVDAGGLVGAVGDLHCACDRVGAGEAGPGAVGDVDRG